MAEIRGPGGARVSRSGTPNQEPGTTRWQDDVRDTMEASDALFSQYEQKFDLDFLNEAIALAQSAITAMTPFHQNRAIVLAKLRKMFGNKFKHTRDVVDLDMAWVWAMEEMGETLQGMTTYVTACSSVLAIRRQLAGVHSRYIFPGGDLYGRYERLGDLADLNEAIIRVEKAIEAYLPGSPARAQMLSNRSAMLLDRFERLGDINDLELAAGANEEIVRETDTRDRVHTCALANLGGILFRRFGRIGDLGDLQNAIKHCEEALAAAPKDHPDRTGGHSNLGTMLFGRFRRIGDLGDLQKAIKHGEEALTTAPQDHPHRGAMHSGLGSWFSTRFEWMGDLGDLQKAMKHGEEALAATPQDHPDRAGMHNNLGAGLAMMFERIGDLRDLQKALKHGEEALSSTPQNHPDRASRHSSLGTMLARRFERMGDLADLQNAIKHSEGALAITPQDHPLRGDMHNKLGEWLFTRFGRMGDLGDLQKAIHHGEEALDVTPLDHPNRVALQCNLGCRFSERFERIGDLVDLQRAIRKGEEALGTAPRDHPSRVAMQGHLGSWLHKRFERIGDLGDLRKAIQHGEESLAATPQDCPIRPVRNSNLGCWLYAGFERLGDFGNLQKAIYHGEEALTATPRDHPNRAVINSNLGAWLYTRFLRIGDLGDLQKAIKYGEEALASTPQDHPDRAARHSNLGNMFVRKFERVGNRTDLQNAIKHSEEALAVTPQDHPLRAAMLGNLGAWLSTRFEWIRDIGDLEKAAKYAKEALDATPRDHPDRADRHCNLGKMLLRRFEGMGDLEDLQRAIEHGEEALTATPRDHPHRADICTILGRLLESRFSRLHSAEDLNRSLRLYLEAYDCRISPPRERVGAARRAAALLYSAGMFRESSSLLEDAINLMPSADLRFLKRDDQQHKLSELSGLASIAASVALQAGREAYHGLKLLELGRGIIMGFSIDSRSDISDLKTDHPLVFNQFHSLRVEIDSPVDEISRTGGETLDQRRNRAISRRWEAVEEMEEILNRIRKLPGYGGFLLPPSRDVLMKMATDGPIVVFNSTAYRSDAIIVTATDITSLELPKLNYKGTRCRMRQLAGFGGGNWVKQGQDNKQMKELLIWLWDAAVGPVFDHLERKCTLVSEGVHNTTLKRIWWIGVGQLSMAPFHAAGDHSPGSTRNSLSRAISTYIPTIKALSYARQRQLRLFGEGGASFSTARSKGPITPKKPSPRLLLVPMPETPGAGRLPGVVKEVRYIRDSAAKNKMEPTLLRNPTPSKVLQQVQHHDIVHFACHGVSEFNPSDSYLALFNQGGNGIGRLLARDISSLVAQNAQIAYLSACSSAKNPSAGLADEVIHLASAFQLSGFSHTLANMWETNDHASSEVARDFYNFLFQSKGGGNGHHRVSAAFHEAVKKYRDNNSTNFLAWAPFVHTGA